MFLYSLQINNKKIFKFLFIILLIIALVLFGFGIYRLFFEKEVNQNADVLTIDDAIKNDAIFEITSSNYTTILQSVNNSLDSYIGLKIHFTGYVYRLIDFDDTKFVLARDVQLNNNPSQTLVVGFLCSYKDALNFSDKTWVDVTGTITKGDYYGSIALIEIEEMHECSEPQDKYVSEPDNTYVPTSSML